MNMIAQFNTKLQSELIKDDLGYLDKEMQIIPEQEKF